MFIIASKNLINIAGLSKNQRYIPTIGPSDRSQTSGLIFESISENYGLSQN